MVPPARACLGAQALARAGRAWPGILHSLVYFYVVFFCLFFFFLFNLKGQGGERAERSSHLDSPVLGSGVGWLPGGAQPRRLPGPRPPLEPPAWTPSPLARAHTHPHFTMAMERTISLFFSYFFCTRQLKKKTPQKKKTPKKKKKRPNENPFCCVLSDEPARPSSDNFVS